MVMAAEAMEQMNAFYRVFFNYENKVPNIELRIFRKRDEYLKYGSNPPEWSGGLHTGNAVETFVGNGGFQTMIGTLFHEAGHQFVGLATNAYSTIWLNEGMATYFEGTRILNNGTVQCNMPANHYLFALTKRMEKGWMADKDDGIDPNVPEQVPQKAPDLETIIACQYRWGPAWYAPVWGVTFFFFNYQDPVDGRFVYREAFRTYIDVAAGRVGKSAIEKLEEVVLANPAKSTPGVDFSEVAEPLPLPKTMAELKEIWKRWLIRLRNEQSGKAKVERPFHQWAKYAVTRGDKDQALEHFEKGLVEQPENVDLLVDFADFLADALKNTDRASKLALRAARLLEQADEVDEAEVKKVDKRLAKWDPKWRALNRIHEELWAAARGLTQRYLDEDLPLMAMHVSWRFGTELGAKDILPLFEEAVRRSGKTLWLWELAYNEKNLDGWMASGDDVFRPDGAELASQLETYASDNFNYQFLTLDKITSGDFSMEAEIYAEAGQVQFAGLLFGKKGVQNCQAVILHPAGSGGEVSQAAFVDLTTFYDAGFYDVWRHNGVGGDFPDWHTLRVDISGRLVDVWYDGNLVMTHEFANLDLLRGQFGLITGVGEARFRNVRYLARPAADPGARIERKVRMEKLRNESMREGTGGSLGGSWLGQVPPWPDQVNWVQEPRAGWEDLGTSPAVLIFWSCQQNEIVPVHEWASHLAETRADVGLKVVSIVSAEDQQGIEAYLEEHPFPGSVGVDRFRRKGYGAVFELFGIGRQFQLPRVLLLDVDHTVIWEGDPGFRRGTPWAPGTETYLDTPLAELIDRRNLRAFQAWVRSWTEKGEPGLLQGRMEEAVKLLLDSVKYDPGLDARVEEAQKRLRRLNTAFDSMETTALSLSRFEAEPALRTLIDWGKLFEKPADAKTLKSLNSSLKGPHGSAWNKTLSQIERFMKSLKPGNELTGSTALLDRLAPYKGLFPRLLRDELGQALKEEDPDRVMEVLSAAHEIPARWLVRDYFKW
jgi:tetratricopeptide (TPR) repeat protein